MISQSPIVLSSGKKIVIAHRGACGYLPEHTLEAKVLAYGMGADYIEQDVVLTKDNAAIILHDIHIDTVTNAAEIFPDRARNDNRYYAIDFTLKEIKSLQVTERIDLKNKAAVYPGRFPIWTCDFKVPTFENEIELIQGLNKSTGKDVGIYPEIKSPAWHKKEGKDISGIVLKILNYYGYKDKNDKCYIQCFDPAEIKRLYNELGAKVKLMQLIAETDWEETPIYEKGKLTGYYDYEFMKTKEGLKETAKYADTIGPWMPQLVKGKNEKGNLIITSLVKDAHALGLEVHPYTFRVDSLPDYVMNSEEAFRIFYYDVGVDGLFTDFPDCAVQFLRKGKIIDNHLINS
ncbi:glycerophosphoryl diester phosphodiesterase GlpQ [Candidatus Magnetomoraceae bacterium gMMP-15]